MIRMEMELSSTVINYTRLVANECGGACLDLLHFELQTPRRVLQHNLLTCPSPVGTKIKFDWNMELNSGGSPVKFPTTNSYRPTAIYPCWVSPLPVLSPFLLSNIFLTAAHPSNPTVTIMNVTTTIWSFLLSLWKQVVKTSFTSAPLHMGSLWAMQNARLHKLHVAAGARRLR